MSEGTRATPGDPCARRSGSRSSRNGRWSARRPGAKDGECRLLPPRRHAVHAQPPRRAACRRGTSVAYHPDGRVAARGPLRKRPAGRSRGGLRAGRAKTASRCVPAASPPTPGSCARNTNGASCCSSVSSTGRAGPCSPTGASARRRPPGCPRAPTSTRASARWAVAPARRGQPSRSGASTTRTGRCRRRPASTRASRC